MSSPFRIAIIGAGPAGCTLARLLHLASIPFTIFESEESPHTRGQGGTLDLRTNTGLLAIKECGLYEEFLKYARFDGESLVIADKHLIKYLNVQPGSKVGGGRPEIDRSQLRDILRGSLPDDAIMWGKKFTGLDPQGNLQFGNETLEGYDLVVGADGAWSKTRRLVSDELPFYTGLSGIECSIPDITNTHPDLYEFVNRGSVFAFSDQKAVMAQQLGSGNLRVAAWNIRDDVWISENPIDSSSARIQLKDKFVGEFESWAPPYRKLLTVADPETLVTRKLFMLPIGFQWDNKRGVTLIGDAAHLMSPFAGEGANLGMRDAVELASFIKKSTSKEELYDNIELFEENMFQRAQGSQERSFGNMQDMILSSGAPRACIERYLLRNMAAEIGPVAMTLLTPLVYGYFWIWKLFH